MFAREMQREGDVDLSSAVHHDAAAAIISKTVKQ
jgi:hypothetical protein